MPTLKITTTTRRHQLLVHEMDINAGRYLDGESFESLAAESFELTLATASGKKSRGEHAGHSQVSILRNWAQTDASRLGEIRARPIPDGLPFKVAGRVSAPPSTASLNIFATGHGHATERVALVLPTSLCAAQIARLAADRLNEKRVGAAQGISRFVSLVHTEGCGFGGESMHQLLHRAYRGYVTHPNVAAALLLEHGCEKVPNDLMRHKLEAAGVPAARFGWASVQLDGGIAKALDKVEAWFTAKLADLPLAPLVSADLGALSLGLLTTAPTNDATVGALVAVVQQILARGGSVLIPESDPLLADRRFSSALLGERPPHATLLYGQPLALPGFHIVASETDHWVENLTGLGACGAHLALTVVHQHARQGHPLLPVIQVAESTQRAVIPADDIDLFLSDHVAENSAALTQLLVAIAQRDRLPAVAASGSVDFQFTRGLLGVTT